MYVYVHIYIYIHIYLNIERDIYTHHQSAMKRPKNVSATNARPYIRKINSSFGR